MEKNKKELSTSDLDFVVVEDESASSIKVDADQSGDTLISRLLRIKKPVFLTLFLLLLSVSFYYFLQTLWSSGSQSGFPVVKAGSYLGTIEHVFPEGHDEHAIFYVERQSDEDSLFFAILKEGYKPETFNLLGEGTLAAVNIVSPDGKLRFSGAESSPGAYSGEVLNLDSKAEGNWNLSLISARSDLDMPAEVEDQVKQWLILRAALYSTDSKIKLAESTVPEQKKEIEKLSNYLTEGQVLKTRSDKKLQEVQSELSVVQAKLKEKQREAKDLAKQLEVSQHVTNAGKLVALSRDSLDREKRWIESMFKTSVEENSGELAQEIQRGEKILDLRVKIVEAKNKLSRLLEERGNQGVVGGEFDEPAQKEIDGFNGRY